MKILFTAGFALTLISACDSAPSPSSPNLNSPASVQPTQVSGSQTSSSAQLYYLTTDSIPVGTWLQAPFAPGSIGEQDDLNTVLGFQNTRTDADCARAKTEIDITLNSFYGPAYGPLSAKEVSLLNSFSEKVENDADYAAGTEKVFWKRPRPYLVDADVHPCLKLETSYAYPSGHSTIAHTLAQVLDLIFPDRKDRIDQRADQIAEDRVMGGVHFPSDIAAGKLMSERVFQAIQQNDDFNRDLKDAQNALK